jgi:hypothetical protein
MTLNRFLIKQVKLISLLKRLQKKHLVVILLNIFLENLNEKSLFGNVIKAMAQYK